MADPKINDMIANAIAKDSVKGETMLLMKEEERQKVELQKNSLVRIKTCGNSPFVGRSGKGCHNGNCPFV